MVGAVPSMEQREENYDPLAIPDVDKSVVFLYKISMAWVTDFLLLLFILNFPMIPDSVFSINSRLNAQYLAVHGNAMLGRHLWLKTSLS